MSEPRYGIWIPVYGNWGATNDPQEPRDASYARAKALLQLAEQTGFTTTLIAQHLIPRNQDFDQLETWAAAAALAEATNKIEIIAAIKPLLFHPVVLAKMALGIDAISGGRFAINVVSAAAGLVGNYDTVAKRIAEFVEAGIDTFMLQFQPFAPEIRRFAEEIMPRVRSPIGQCA